ncbi:MAG: hypothetical protein GQ574_01190 [Crocinitomix sp.]|nr:hypothetical protein [Crocinitomix sp.]
MTKTNKIYIAFVVIIAFACTKNFIGIDLTSHTEQKIVGEGYFTDSLMKHQFLFTVSNNLGSTELNYAQEVGLLVKTPEGIRSFSQIGDGLFESDEEFKGTYGANYTIQFSYKGDVHEVETIMPSPISINEVDYQVFDSLNGYGGQGEISMNISSPIDQYMQFKLFRGSIEASSGDTLWNEIILPVYRIAKINAGDNLDMRLPIEDYDSFYLTSSSLIKIKTSIISTDVGEYLLKLKNYVQNELINNQSYNAPFYYSNEAYGLGYGTILDSLIHQY